MREIPHGNLEISDEDLAGFAPRLLNSAGWFWLIYSLAVVLGIVSCVRWWLA